MSETKKITTMYVVTDTENSYDKIGDIDGGIFDEAWLSDYIQEYGSNKLINKLSNMIYQVMSTERILLLKRDNNRDA